MSRALNLLRNEITRTLMLLGCPDVKQLNRSFIRTLDREPARAGDPPR